MKDDYGVQIAGGQREYKGKIFRFAHLGYMNQFDVLMGLNALEMALSEIGCKVEFGRGVATAQKVFSERLKNQAEST